MPALVVGGVTVPVAADGGVTETRLQIGEVVRSFDGTPRSSVRDAAREWDVRTVPITTTAAGTLLAQLEGSHPISCSGDLLGGSISCTPTDIVVTPQKIKGTTLYKVVSFRLLAAP